MKVNQATTHVKYYASHQMVITKLQTFNELEHVQGTEKSLRILQLNMERLNWFLGDVRIPKFNYNINYKTNQVTTFSEFMFGTQIHPKTAFSFRDTIYNSMINNDETWIYQEGIELMRTLKTENYGFKDYSLENFITRGTKPLGKGEPHWDLAYVDLEAFCQCTKYDRKKAFSVYEDEMIDFYEGEIR